MFYPALQKALPGFLRRHVLHFDCVLEEAVGDFSDSLAAGAVVLDAGAGEARHASHFSRHRYVAVDLAVGDSKWNYRNLDALADLKPDELSPRDALEKLYALKAMSEQR